jgi:2-polyprenyl-3-methyl-5-hydroxy-6-metoxy-1,4-benzoquinol methylase
MLAERLQAEELMDNPALDAETYRTVLTDLARVNRTTMAYRPTLDFLRRAVGRRRAFRLLDVGFGGGDMLRRIALWAKRCGIAAELTGIDLNPRSAAVAGAAPSPGAPIRYLTGDYATLAGGNFDCIISSLVAHHMSHEQLVDFVGFMDREAMTGWFVNDLHRHGFAWSAFPLLARTMGWHRVVRLDGMTSIARSYRPAEWPPILAEAGVEGARVRRRFPFRLCVEKIR